MTHAWEVAGCLVLLVMLIAFVLLAGRWLDEQFAPEDLWGGEE